MPSSTSLSRTNVVDPTLPWNQFLVRSGSDPKAAAVGRSGIDQDAMSNILAPSTAVRQPLGGRADSVAEDAARLLVKRPAWIGLSSDTVSGAPTYELERSGWTWLSSYAHPEAEAEYWRFALWRRRWEPPAMLAAVFVSFALRLVAFAELGVAMTIIYAAVALVLCLASAALFTAVKLTRPDAETGIQRLRASFLFQILPFVGVALALIGAIVGHAVQGADCGAEGRFATNAAVCVRQMTSDYAGFQLIAGLLVPRTDWTFGLLIATHTAAIVAFSMNSDYSRLDVGIFGALGCVVVAIYTVLNALQVEQQRRQFQLAVNITLSHKELTEQASALSAVARFLLPRRVAGRLEVELACGARGGLRKSLESSSDRALVVGVHVRHLQGSESGDVVFMARCIHRLFVALDVSSLVHNLDHAGTVGDTYLVSSGLHDQPHVIDRLAVASFLSKLHQIAVASCLDKKGDPLSSDARTRRLVLSAGVDVNDARAEFIGKVGVRYVVSGTAVATALRLCRVAPPHYLTLSLAAAAELATHFAAIASTSALDSTLILLDDIRVRDAANAPMNSESSTPAQSGGTRLGGGDSAGGVGLIDGPPTSRESISIGAIGMLVNPADRSSSTAAFSVSTTREGEKLTDDASTAVAVVATTTPPPAAVASTIDPMEIHWGGWFALDQTELAYHAFAAAEVRRATIGSCVLVAVWLAAVVLAIGIEQALDDDLRRRTVPWRVGAALAVLLIGVFGNAVYGAFINFHPESISSWRAASLIYVAALALVSWVPSLLMPENIISNRVHIMGLMLFYPNAMVLQSFPWSASSAIVMLFLGAPIIAISEWLAAQGPAFVFVTVLAASAIAVWCARMCSMEGRHRFAEASRISATVEELQDNAETLRLAALSAFPRQCVGAALELISRREKPRARPHYEQHYCNLVVAVVSVPGNAASTILRLLSKAMAVELGHDVTLLQLAGNEAVLGAGFEATDEATAAGLRSMLRFLSQLLTIADAHGSFVIASIAVEEGQAILAGGSSGLRYHVVGRALTVASALVRAVEPSASDCPSRWRPAVVACADVVQWLRAFDRSAMSDPDLRWAAVGLVPTKPEPSFLRDSVLGKRRLIFLRPLQVADRGALIGQPQ